VSGRHLFDASSIIALVIKRRVDLLVGGYTLELAGYEIGSYLWKEIYLTRSVSLDDLPKLESLFVKILGKMNVVRGLALSAEVVKLAGELNLMYYDGSYLYHAGKLGLALVTEDGELREKAEKATQVMKAEDMYSRVRMG
jgi:predicted nucleic acid-binding protein